jgi:hypothetical protein
MCSTSLDRIAIENSTLFVGGSGSRTFEIEDSTLSRWGSSPRSFEIENLMLSVWESGSHVSKNRDAFIFILPGLTTVEEEGYRTLRYARKDPPKATVSLAAVPL